MKKLLLILSVLLVLLLSYWRYTYILNPNFAGESFIIEIKSEGGNLMAYSIIKIKSVITYWILFLAGNTLLFRTVFASNRSFKIALLFFFLVSAISAFIFGLDFFVGSRALYVLGSLLKNFVLSPVFPAISFIVLHYLRWFDKAS